MSLALLSGLGLILGGALVGSLVRAHDADRPSTVVSSRLNDLTVLTQSQMPFLGLARSSGTLAYLEPQDCFVLRRTPIARGDVGPGTAALHELVVWPAGTTAFREGSRIGVRVPGHDVLWVGEHIILGGGAIPDALSEFGVAQECISDGSFLTSAVVPKASTSRRAA